MTVTMDDGKNDDGTCGDWLAGMDESNFYFPLVIAWFSQPASTEYVCCYMLWANHCLSGSTAWWRWASYVASGAATTN